MEVPAVCRNPTAPVVTFVAVKARFGLELQGPPGAGGELVQEFPVVAEEDPEPLGDGEDLVGVSSGSPHASCDKRGFWD